MTAEETPAPKLDVRVRTLVAVRVDDLTDEMPAEELYEQSLAQVLEEHPEWSMLAYTGQDTDRGQLVYEFEAVLS